MRNYYDDLGISKNATASEIRNAYKQMAKTHHPDRGGDESKFKIINEAYQILSNADKKADYDIKLNRTKRKGRFTFSFDDFFNVESDGFEDDPFIRNHYGKNPPGTGGFNKKSNRKEKTKGSDLKISIDIYPEDTLREFSKKFTYQRNILCNNCKGDGYKKIPCSFCNSTGTFKIHEGQYVKCSYCEGTGLFDIACQPCEGDGLIKERKEVKINIPKGITYNSTTRMKGFGNQGTNGNFGDLIIHIKDIISSEDFKIKQIDKHKVVYTNEEIDFFDVITGGIFSFNTLKGKREITIEPLQLFKDNSVKIMNAGIPKEFGMQKYTPHLIFFNINYPNLTKEQLNEIKKIKQVVNEHNSKVEEDKGSGNTENEIDGNYDKKHNES